MDNPQYRRGSLVSLWTQRERLTAGGGVILMDADVLCDARMLARLGDGSAENTLLVDRELEPGDEPVKLCFRKDASGARADRGLPQAPRDTPTTGTASRSASSASQARMAAELAARCDDYVSASRLDVEYEEAIRDLILFHPDRFGAVDVSDLPWTEIDFEEDVVRARTHVLPQLTDA